MSEKTFTIIEDWMLNLGLSSNELLIYATIYGFNKNDEKTFTGRFEYFANRFHITRRTVIRIMQRLVDKNLIIKEKGILNGQYSCCNSYKVNSDIISLNQCQNVTSECQNVTPEVTKCHASQCQNVTPEVTKCHASQCQNVTPKYNKPNTSNEYNETNTSNEYNNLSPNGESESDIVESENGDECYCESDNSQTELSFGDNNTVNAEGDKKSAGSKKNNAKTGTKTKKAQEAGQDFIEQPPSRELASQKNNKNRVQESEQNSRAEPTSRELASQKDNKNRVQERFEKFWAAYPRHIDKAKALKAFTKINPSDELLEQMLNNINEAKKTTQWQTQQYIPYPTTWLNGSRWEDEIDPKDIDKDIAHTLDNPIDRAAANDEDISDLWDW